MALLHRIESHLARTRLAASTFGKEAVGDPGLVSDLRRGRRLGAALEGRIEAYLVAREAMLRGARCPTR